MTPADYLGLIVLPSLSDLLAEPLSQRHALVACILTAHLVDHIDVANGSPAQGKHKIRGRLRAVGPHSAACLAILEGVSNGTKHAKPDDGTNRPVKFAPGMERRAPAFAWGTSGVGWGEGRWGSPGIYVEHVGEHWFLDTCAAATVRAYALAFPALLGAVDLGPVSPMLAHLAALDAPPAIGGP